MAFFHFFPSKKFGNNDLPHRSRVKSHRALCNRSYGHFRRDFWPCIFFNFTNSCCVSTSLLSVASSEPSTYPASDFSHVGRRRNFPPLYLFARSDTWDIHWAPEVYVVYTDRRRSVSPRYSINTVLRRTKITSSSVSLQTHNTHTTQPNTHTTYTLVARARAEGAELRRCTPRRRPTTRAARRARRGRCAAVSWWRMDRRGSSPGE